MYKSLWCSYDESLALKAAPCCAPCGWAYRLAAVGGTHRGVEKRLAAARHKLAVYERQPLEPTGVRAPVGGRVRVGGWAVGNGWAGGGRRAQARAGGSLSGGRWSRVLLLLCPASCPRAMHCPCHAATALVTFCYADQAAACVADHWRPLPHRLLNALLCGCSPDAPPRLQGARVRVAR